MGLDTTHDCWHGAYSAFHRWRQELARAAGLPPLELMEGFFCPRSGPRHGGQISTFYLGVHRDELVERSFDRLESHLPIRWECLKPDALYELLHHSDCEGEIPWKSCGPIADSLERLLPKLPDGEGGGHIGNWRDKTKQFISGLRDAAKEKQNVEFH